MVSLRLFLLVLVTLVCREVAGSEPERVWLSSLIAIAGISVGFGLLTKASAVSVLRSSGLGSTGTASELKIDATEARFSRARRVIETVWVVILPVSLVGTGWGTWLNALEPLGLPKVAVFVCWFLPSVVFLALIEMTAAQFDEIVAEALPQKASTTSEMLGWREHWKLRLRLGELSSLMSCLAPLLLIALFTDVIAMLAGGALTDDVVTVIATLLSIALVLWVLPVWLGRWMGAEQLPQGPLRDRILGYQRELNLLGLEPMLLRTHGRWAGAAVVGGLRPFRQLWLGDALISQLNERELDMVLMHEMAHVIRRHAFWRILPLIWAVGAACLIGAGLTCVPEGSISVATGQFSAAAAACATLMFGIGHVARRCELDADQQACRLAIQVCDWAQTDPEAAPQALGEALSRLLKNTPDAAKSTWLHPSLQNRLLNLADWAADRKMPCAAS